MEFKVIKTSNLKYKQKLNVETLDDLMEFIKNEGPSIIFRDNTIEIYDDYRE